MRGCRGSDVSSKQAVKVTNAPERDDVPACGTRKDKQ